MNNLHINSKILPPHSSTSFYAHNVEISVPGRKRRWETEIDRDAYTDGQINRKTQRQTDSWTQRQTVRQLVETKTNRKTVSWNKDKQIDS